MGMRLKCVRTYGLRIYRRLRYPSMSCRHYPLPQKCPLLATTFQVGDSIVEQGDELVICVLSGLCGHFTDYDLQQLVGGRYNVGSDGWWKFNLSLGVDVREEQAPALVEDGEPAPIHANPHSFAHEQQNGGGGATRMIDGHGAVHRTVRIMGIIVPTVWDRHQQAGSSKIVQTDDLAVEVLGACCRPDGGGNVQTLGDLVEEVVVDLAPVAVLLDATRIRHSVGWVGSFFTRKP